MSRFSGSYLAGKGGRRSEWSELGGLARGAGAVAGTENPVLDALLLGITQLLTGGRHRITVDALPQGAPIQRAKADRRSALAAPQQRVEAGQVEPAFPLALAVTAYTARSEDRLD